jgi:quinol monooxygenase YgiN
MIRIVKMHFREEETENFRALFEEVYPLISTFPGCTRLELLQDIHTPGIFFTYSFWEGPEELENYRRSELFANTWRKTKALFEQPAQAWSVEKQK